MLQSTDSECGLQKKWGTKMETKSFPIQEIDMTKLYFQIMKLISDKGLHITNVKIVHDSIEAEVPNEELEHYKAILEEACPSNNKEIKYFEAYSGKGNSLEILRFQNK